MTTVPISVVIVNFNSGRYLEECIRSCTDQTDEIIVVDNASSDDSLRLRSIDPVKSNLKIIQNRANYGFAKACNIGYRQTSFPFVLFLNPDCKLEKNSARKLSAALNSQVDFGMVGGVLVGPDGREQPGGRRSIPTPIMALFYSLGLTRLNSKYSPVFPNFQLHNTPLPKSIIEVEAISGACLMVKRNAVDEVGLWDEKYFLHCEDLDWCKRFNEKGWKILFEPSARVVHYLGKCSGERPFFIEWMKHRGMARFYLKFFHGFYPLGLIYLVLFGVLVRFLLSCAWLFCIRSIRKINCYYEKA